MRMMCQGWSADAGILATSDPGRSPRSAQLQVGHVASRVRVAGVTALGAHGDAAAQQGS